MPLINHEFTTPAPPPMSNFPNQKPTLQFIYVNEYGDTTDVKKDLDGVTIESLFNAIRESLLACGFGQASVDEWFPEE